MKIALDARLVGGRNTGDSTYWTGLLHGIVPSDFEGKIYCISDQDRPAGFPQDNRLKWVRVSARNSRWFSLVQFPLACRRLKADVAHVQYSISPVQAGRVVTTIHDVSFFIGPDWFKPKDRFLLRIGIPRAVRQANQIITVSETSRLEIEKFLPAAKGKITVTPLACPPWIRAVDKTEAKTLVAKEFGIEGSYVLSVSTRWPRKNMDLAVKAIQILAANYGEARPEKLVLTGRFGWGNAKSDSRVLTPGFVSNELLCALYSGADLYLCPSFHEGFGLPILEAFRTGCPVMASSGGAIPETAKGAAEIVKSWSAEDWAARMNGLLSDPGKLNQLREAGRQAEGTYTWEQTAKKTLEAYRLAMGR